MNRLFKQFLLFFVLIITAELGLRVGGIKTGVLDAQMFPPDTMIYDQLFQADSLGISSYYKQSPILPDGHVINAQGFLGAFDYDRATIDSIRQNSNKKIVMLIGDSYAEGCCVNPVDSSFAARLMADTGIVVLNFGVGATDLTQYRLVVERYVKELVPDLVMVMFYLGNDISYEVRTNSPHTPVCYPIRDYVWLNSVGPEKLMKLEGVDYFLTAEEAYQFYLRHYTLFGSDATKFEKVIRQSIIASRIYMRGVEIYENSLEENDRIKIQDPVSHIDSLLNLIQLDCEKETVDVVIATIPSPLDLDNEISLEANYSKYFSQSGIPTFYPDVTGYSSFDYDGMETGNHFNNAGHSKYYVFLDSVIRTQLGP